MGGLFSMDGGLYRIGNLLADILVLGLLWIFFSIPIITMGASTTALYYVFTRRLSDREGYLFKDFLTSFRSNFVTATMVWLTHLFLVALLAFNVYISLTTEIMGTTWFIYAILNACFLLEVVIVSVFAYPITARFDMNYRKVVKSAFLTGNRHLFTSIACLAVGAAIIWSIFMIYLPILLVGMGIYGYVTSIMIMRVFKKYRPEMDEDPADPNDPDYVPGAKKPKIKWEKPAWRKKTKWR
jgi:uncharacterized membrane protein YesL